MKTFIFGIGSHESRDDGMCIMEAVAYIAGEDHSDHPICASPIISTFLRSWNDDIKDDARRSELLSQFVFRLPGTAASEEIELQRSWMCFDWLVREYTAELMSRLHLKHAEIIRSFPEINASNFNIIAPILNATYGATYSATYCVDMSAVMSAVKSAAYSAAYGVAYGATYGAAHSVDTRVAYDLARRISWYVVQNFTYNALQVSVIKLQESAVKLVDRMINLTEIKEISSVQTKGHLITS